MNFQQQLNDYIRLLGCTGKELAAAAHLSEGALSRYRSGERTPAGSSLQLEKLAAGLAGLARVRDIPLSEEEVLEQLQMSVSDGISVEDEDYLANLNTLIRVLGLSHSELAREMSYDPSYISRILSGQRRPADRQKFTSQVAYYIARRCSAQGQRGALAELLGLDEDALAEDASCAGAVARWLGSNQLAPSGSPINGFLTKLDAFDLDEYIQAIHFDRLKVPGAPFSLPTSRRYSGLGEMMESELDFVKATVLSKSREDIIFYSDMPMDEMAKNEAFAKKWMFGMALLLKKGLHLHMIHNVNRPFHEMLLGLESWIPMYMTGQISPYYLKNPQNDVFLYTLKVSGAAVQWGEAIAGHHGDGRYFLTNSKEDLRYYRRRGEQLLKKALPLMEIYRSDRQKAFGDRLRSLNVSGNRRIICSSLPLFTVSQALLERMLRERQVLPAEADRIRRFALESREQIERMAQSNRLTLEVPLLTEAEFRSHPLSLSLAELFYASELCYTYEEYLAHLEETRVFMASHSNCTLKEDPSPAFRNISITVIEGKIAIVSKGNSPVIHFVIEHPRMVDALARFVPMIDENTTG